MIFFFKLKEISILAQNSEYFTSSLHILSINLANRLEKKFHEFCLNNENEINTLTLLRQFNARDV